MDHREPNRALHSQKAATDSRCGESREAVPARSRRALRPHGRKSTKLATQKTNSEEETQKCLADATFKPIPVGQWSHPDAGTGRSVDRSPPWDEFARRQERGITISISRFGNPHSVLRGLYPVQEKS
ncbi:unnamed protein product [Phytophthora fragariaefolia]|uniref:Unnamed protein product n=1 Tax=Phytophthora fragariaefolia TaxID=1490495 RepID=A0A9W6TUC8_9STRA|nr:unnamed protein product [Phytophthora fragariaefolia]